MMVEELLFNIAMILISLASVVWLEKQVIKLVVWFIKQDNKKDE